MSAFLLRLLAQGEWGRAMLAELAAIEDPRARRRFARGCVRALMNWPRLACFALWAAVPVLLFTGPGHGPDPTALVIVGTVLVTCFVGVLYADPSLAAPVAALVWWAALLDSATVRA